MLEEDLALVDRRRSLLEAEVAHTDRLTRESNGCARQLSPVDSEAERRPQLDLISRSKSSMHIPELVSDSPEKVVMEHLKKAVVLHAEVLHEEQIVNESLFLTRLASLKSQGKRRYTEDCKSVRGQEAFPDREEC